MDTRKILLALTVLCFSFSAFLAWYLFGSRPPEHSLALNRAQLEAEGLQEQLADPSINTASRRVPASPISKGRATSAIYLDHGNVQYYDPDTGKVWQVRSDGSNEELISGATLPGFLGTYWSPNEREVITAFATSRGTSYRYFDYGSKRAVSIGLKMFSLAFSPDGAQIAYFIKDTAGGSIYLSSPDGQDSKKIFTTRLSDIMLSWPARDTLSFTTRDPQTNLISLFTLTLDGKLANLADSLSGLEVLWSPDGSKVLFSYFDQDGLLVTRSQEYATRAVSKLDIRARASECVWTQDQTRLICGVSQTPISIAVLETQQKTPADFYEFSLAENTKKLLFSSGVRSAKASISQIFLSATEEYVFFINRYDEKLYSFKY